ncbi:MAG: hypothetical protein JKY48_19315 [Flavobacteriales bacterium]|nr:hypothetical protein [Flavobacteriales bacterium]
MWLFGKYKDLTILYLPVWLVWIVLFFLSDSVLQSEVPLWVWVVFILGIDVSHVWSTIFRTYLDKEEFKNHRLVLLLAPLVSFILLFGIARESTLLFWQLLAYLAVFHFMKQQYGFFAIYSAKAKLKRAHRYFKDKWVLYFSMLYPVVFWHLSNRNFVWFVDGDFISFPLQLDHWVRIALELIYWLSISGWLIEEVLLVKKGNNLSYGRILWMLSTLLNWYLGIVWFNSDLAFTLTNVVAHGVPYMALIIFYQVRKKKISSVFSKNRIYVLAFSIIIFSMLLAFGEEYLWDIFINREKEFFFSSIIHYPFDTIRLSSWQPLLLALLSLPQVTHYIIDGFIWKMNETNPHLKTVLISKENG